MARIPKFESTKQITDLSPTDRVAQDIFARPFSSPDKTIETVSTAMKSLSEHFQQVQLETEFTKADTEARRRLKELELEAETSESLNPDEYRDKIKKIREEVAQKNITIPGKRREFDLKLDNLALEYEFGIRRTLRNRSIDKDVATLYENLDEMEDSYIKADGVNKTFVAQDMISAIDQRVKNGVIKSEEGQKLKENTLTRWQISQIHDDIYKNPVMALEEIEKGDKGIYKGYPLIEKTKFIGEANQRIDKIRADAENTIKEETNRWEEAVTDMKVKGTLTEKVVLDLRDNSKIGASFADATLEDLRSSKARVLSGIEKEKANAVNEREIELLDMKAAGTLTEEIVREERASKAISAQFALSQLEALKKGIKPAPTELEKITEYNKLVEWRADINKREWSPRKEVSFEELSKFRAAALNASVGKFITDEEFGHITGKTKDGKDLSKIYYRNPVFNNALEELAARSTFYETAEGKARAKADLYSSFISKVMAGKEVPVALQEAKSELFQRELGEAVKAEEELKKKSNRIRIQNKAGRVIYSDDGEQTWYDEKTGEQVK